MAWFSLLLAHDLEVGRFFSLYKCLLFFLLGKTDIGSGKNIKDVVSSSMYDSWEKQ